MRFVSLFSGIEAASLAWEPLGWECVAFSEIDPFASRVLAARYPGVINLGDVKKITELDVMMWGSVDMLIFGSPCQDLSVAGNRKGLAGERSGLFHDAMRVIRWVRAHCGLRFALWENVFGAFSSNEGRDFAVVVGEMAGIADIESIIPTEGRDAKGRIKWGSEGAIVGNEAMVEWSTLDAQWFGVAQRRRRVFALADFGDWVSRPPILLEPESVRGDSPPRRGQGQGVAGTLTRGLGERGAEDGERGLLHVSGTLNAQCWRGVNQQMAHAGLLHVEAYMPARTFGADGGVDEIFAERDVADALHTSSGNGNKAPIVAFGGNNTSGPIDVAAAVNAKGGSGRMDFESETLLVGCVTGDVTHALTANGFDASEDGTGRGTPLIGFYPTNRQPDFGNYENVSPTLKVGTGTGNGANAAGVAGPFGVRRFTPLECERLQGMPDGWTDVATKVKRLMPTGAGPCVKQTVTATVVDTSGRHWVATNHCMTPQKVCPRAGMPTGVGYELCRSVCNQPAHAEVNAIRFAGKKAKGATLYLQGHTYACQSCLDAARKAGVIEVIIGAPPGNADDGPRYKALGNSMAVPVINWIGRSIEAACMEFWQA
jgi:DNA (cytosine-5)-methyltransferase 1